MRRSCPNSRANRGSQVPPKVREEIILQYGGGTSKRTAFRAAVPPTRQPSSLRWGASRLVALRDFAALCDLRSKNGRLASPVGRGDVAGGLPLSQLTGFK
ncbi:hypothetical protein HPB50_009760 [Hyalomma asiaticum]|uniref:Uncharacterized protein n=1 Tax=Hyalomma asiaticum TaxID=266040 RepID=A0ACB7RYU7_HYAAI|nr:hypothetical protein HPB50_009760 [Hyalomma asiaticum]